MLALRMRIPLRLLVLAFSFLVALPTVQAEEWPRSVRGIKVVVPDARGKRSYGGAKLTKSLEKTLREALGELVSERDLAKAQKKLKHSRRDSGDSAKLAEAGREAGAQYVLTVDITKEGWLFTARAQLINTATGESQMDFRSQYYKPSSETADRGFRIARKTIEKLDILVKEGGVPGAIAAAPPPPPPPAWTSPPPPPPSSNDLRVDPPPPPEPAPPPDSVTNDRIDDRVAPPPPPPPTPEYYAAAPPPPPPSFSSGNASVVTTVEPAPSEESEIFRATIAGGSGILRTYNLTAPAFGGSGLSHRLEPLALIHAELEVIVPQIPISVVARGSFLPVRYQVRVLDEEASEPGGTMLDTALLAGYHIVVAGSGKNALKLMPAVGARLALSSVADHPGSIILSTTTFATIVAFGLRMPINEVLEVDISVDGGLVLGYSEDPATSGEFGSGFTVGGDLDARIWLSEYIGIAFDNRFSLDRLTFTGAPSRRVPIDEEGALQDASITTKDLRASIGLAFRF